MIAILKKSSWKWFVVAVIIIVALSIIGLTGKKETMNSDTAPIVIDELRTVIPNVLEITKTTSDYVHGQHIVWVEGRFKSTDEELYLTFITNEGKQLENGIRKADEIKSLDDGWLTFRHKLIETTGEVTHTPNITIIFHLKQDGKNIKGLLTVPAKQPGGILTQSDSKKNDEKNNQSIDNKNWEVISREDRVQGTIIELDMTEDTLNSITLKGIRRIVLPNNPVDYDFEGKIFNIVFNEELANAGKIKDKLKTGAEIVVTLAQYAPPSSGQKNSGTIIGGYLKDICYFEDGKYYDIRGKEVDLKPAYDIETQ